MNEAVKAMIAKPGFYRITTPELLLLHGRYSAVEVDEDGTVYQLNKDDQRDGVLGPDGWHPDTLVAPGLDTPKS